MPEDCGPGARLHRVRERAAAFLDPPVDRHPPRMPATFRKLDAVALLTGPFLPTPQVQLAFELRLASVRDAPMAWSGKRV